MSAQVGWWCAGRFIPLSPHHDDTRMREIGWFPVFIDVEGESGDPSTTRDKGDEAFGGSGIGEPRPFEAGHG